MDYAAIARILGRWAGSALITYGIIDPQYAAGLDADLALIFGAVIGGGAEVWFTLSERWRKQ